MRNTNITKKVNSFLPFFAATGLLSSYSMQTYAGNDELLQILLSNGAINQEQYDALIQSSQQETKVSLDKGQLKIKSGDDSFSLAVGGRLQADAAWYSDDSDGSTTNRGELGDGTELRRARIFVAGTAWNDWDFKGEYDFAQNSVSVNDAWLRYTGLENTLGFPLDITIGHQKEPFSLEQQMSSNHFTFMERALPFALAPLRNIGLTLSSYGENLGTAWTASAGWFGDGIEDSNNDGNDEGYGYVGRVTAAPFASKTRVLHFGGSMEYRKLKGDDVRVSSKPESNISDARLVDVTLTEMDDLIRYNAEFATVYGPFSAQAEYFYNDYDGESGQGAHFDGYYGYVSYFLTGESRNYSKKSGTFTRVTPKSIVGKGGWGAWEIAARYSALDLNDGDYEGGREENWTLGVNWYATSNIRFMGNYIFTDTSGDAPVNVDPQVMQVRAMIDF